MDFRRQPVGRFEFRASPWGRIGAGRVRRVVVWRSEVTVWTGGGRRCWVRGGVAFHFAESGGGRGLSRHILAVGEGPVVVLDASGFPRARYLLLRRHLENFMATGGTALSRPPGFASRSDHRYRSEHPRGARWGHGSRDLRTE